MYSCVSVFLSLSTFCNVTLKKKWINNLLRMNNLYTLVLHNHMEALRMQIWKSKVNIAGTDDTWYLDLFLSASQTLKTLNPGSSIMPLSIFQFDFVCPVNTHISPHVKMTLAASTGSFSLFKGSTGATEGALPWQVNCTLRGKKINEKPLKQLEFS